MQARAPEMENNEKINQLLFPSLIMNYDSFKTINNELCIGFFVYLYLPYFFLGLSKCKIAYVRAIKIENLLLKNKSYL